jgi:hypothetical protein
MIKELKFKKFSLTYDEEQWVDLNIDEESSPPKPINNNSCWLMPKNEKNDYLKRGTCILIKEFAPDIDVVAREQHNEQVMGEVETKLDISVFESSNEDYLGFDEHLINIAYSHYHKKVTETGKVLYMAKYIIEKELYNLLVVIKFFDVTSPDILSNINKALKNIN